VGEVLPGEPSRAEVRLDPGEPELVVAAPLLGVGEDLVRLGDLLELLLGRFRVLLRDVGVVLSREATVGRLDLVRRSGLRYAQDFVVIALRHARTGRVPGSYLRLGGTLFTVIRPRGFARELVSV
jgi:hypothetical protein